MAVDIFDIALLPHSRFSFHLSLPCFPPCAVTVLSVAKSAPLPFCDNTDHSDPLPKLCLSCQFVGLACRLTAQIQKS